MSIDWVLEMDNLTIEMNEKKKKTHELTTAL
jgi:hypothetical protein